MINGVLVERTVDDVLPALATNSDGLKKVLDELVKQYKRQQEEMEKWKVETSTLKIPLSDHELVRGAAVADGTLFRFQWQLTVLGCRKRTTSRLCNNSVGTLSTRRMARASPDNIRARLQLSRCEPVLGTTHSSATSIWCDN